MEIVEKPRLERGSAHWHCTGWKEVKEGGNRWPIQVEIREPLGWKRSTVEGGYGGLGLDDMLLLLNSRILDPTHYFSPQAGPTSTPPRVAQQKFLERPHFGQCE